MKTTIIRFVLIIPLLGGAIPGHCAECLAGRFHGGGLDLVFDSQAGQGIHSGTLAIGGSSFTFTANETAEGLAGTFTTPDGQFDFKAILKGDGLTVTSGNRSYRLRLLAAHLN